MNKTEYLLTCLAEECVEVSKEVSKALRFGLGDKYNNRGPTNQEKIIDELNDLFGVIDILIENGILPKDWVSAFQVDSKKRKIQKWMEYARKCRALNE